MSNLTTLEKAVLETFLDGEDQILSTLRSQLGKLNVEKREFTGAGFYTKFRLSPETRRAPGNRSLNLSDVLANIAGMKMGAGFVLLVRDGAIHTLEGYSYGDESWPEEITTFEVGYLAGNKMSKDRDMDALRKELSMHSGG
jgi:hypothetical protein